MAVLQKRIMSVFWSVIFTQSCKLWFLVIDQIPKMKMPPFTPMELPETNFMNTRVNVCFLSLLISIELNLCGVFWKTNWIKDFFAIWMKTYPSEYCTWLVFNNSKSDTRCNSCKRSINKRKALFTGVIILSNPCKYLPFVEIWSPSGSELQYFNILDVRPRQDTAQMVTIESRNLHYR